ncbi:hypothetical protein M5K25_027989 [Dendrobium thyrsiflorum]|uniref:Uncharacterized protein n=1 Tax=Dendrobium thyrsiflorum TaxID=117978 RepID=A0ABD0TVI1_DENTH
MNVLRACTILKRTRIIKTISYSKRKEKTINDKGKKFTLVEDPKQDATERCQVVLRWLRRECPKYNLRKEIKEGMGNREEAGSLVVWGDGRRWGGWFGLVERPTTASGGREDGGGLGWFGLVVRTTAARKERREEEAWQAGGGRERKGKIEKTKSARRPVLGTEFHSVPSQLFGRTEVKGEADGGDARARFEGGSGEAFPARKVTQIEEEDERSRKEWERPTGKHNIPNQISGQQSSRKVLGNNSSKARDSREPRSQEASPNRQHKSQTAGTGTATQQGNRSPPTQETKGFGQKPKTQIHKKRASDHSSKVAINTSKEMPNKAPLLPQKFCIQGLRFTLKFQTLRPLLAKFQFPRAATAERSQEIAIQPPRSPVLRQFTRVGMVGSWQWRKQRDKSARGLGSPAGVLVRRPKQRDREQVSERRRAPGAEPFSRLRSSSRAELLSAFFLACGTPIRDPYRVWNSHPSSLLRAELPSAPETPGCALPPLLFVRACVLANKRGRDGAEHSHRENNSLELGVFLNNSLELGASLDSARSLDNTLSRLWLGEWIVACAVTTRRGSNMNPQRCCLKPPKDVANRVEAGSEASVDSNHPISPRLSGNSSNTRCWNEWERPTGKHNIPNQISGQQSSRKVLRNNSSKARDSREPRSQEASPNRQHKSQTAGTGTATQQGNRSPPTQETKGFGQKPKTQIHKKRTSDHSSKVAINTSKEMPNKAPLLPQKVCQVASSKVRLNGVDPNISVEVEPNRTKTGPTRVDRKPKSPKRPPFAKRIAPMRPEQRKQLRSTPILVGVFEDPVTAFFSERDETPAAVSSDTYRDCLYWRAGRPYTLRCSPHTGTTPECCRKFQQVHKKGYVQSNTRMGPDERIMGIYVTSRDAARLREDHAGMMANLIKIPKFRCPDLLWTLVYLEHRLNVSKIQPFPFLFSFSIPFSFLSALGSIDGPHGTTLYPIWHLVSIFRLEYSSDTILPQPKIAPARARLTLKFINEISIITPKGGENDNLRDNAQGAFTSCTAQIVNYVIIHCLIERHNHYELSRPDQSHNLPLTTPKPSSVTTKLATCTTARPPQEP